MKVNYKQMYLMLKQQRKALEPQSEKVNEIPENFNQVGYELTNERVEEMLTKMKHLSSIKGKRLTPQFYRSIYNRAIIALGELDKLIEVLETSDESIDYEAECTKLLAEIHAIQSAPTAQPENSTDGGE